ncbi:MAG: VOC family protein [Flavisolibacter sp.]
MTLVPYIMFDGNCEEAIYFYAKVFKGKIKTLSYFDEALTKGNDSEKKGVMHARLSAEGVELMASDEPKKENLPKKGGMVQLSLSFNDAQQQKEVLNALSENAM